MDNGLEATSIQATDPSFDIVGNGRWLVDAADVLGSRSYVTATLTSRDVEETMRRLNYEPGIASDSMNILLDLEWSGSPRADIFEVLDGDVQVRLGNGQLEEVEPGAGRMFGLMSIAALPRRFVPSGAHRVRQATADRPNSRARMRSPRTRRNRPAAGSPSTC